MSRIWGAEAVRDVAPVTVAGFRPAEGGFRSLYTAPAGQLTAAMRGAVVEVEPEIDLVEEARMEAFTLGFDEGCRVTAEANSADTDARARLAEALDLLAPAPSGMLSTMLSATVVRLVEQIVGEVEIDLERLIDRCDTVAAFIESNQDKSALHLHPDDVALLEGETIGVPMVADKSMQRGCVRLETADGWVEDGPDVRLSRLRALMDDMEGKS
ncbi:MULTISPECIES: FliH/SctL family protein [Sphingobium]|uniref:FliH/SctL family protein n=1 Tax=Sphingobium TaxID=165695 RepID=UPI000C4F4B72|nr:MULTISPECIES: FliH/SctL family protein [Sphingobium]MAX16340.1 flagellar biosynthesis protein [Sphingobium sp.]MBA38208.1 flagellar biosynthesis protein [Sphingobium sp.]MBS48276.1 flagellar biosynthesis protein [Sphingobium sp.]MCC4256938.1 flagellar assembly protein FliH [Sphingobium lactosutens]